MTCNRYLGLKHHLNSTFCWFVYYWLLQETLVDRCMEDWQRVASAVRRRRGEIGLTQDEAAELAGIGLSTWTNVESARGESYRPKTLVAICRALGWKSDSIERLLIGEPAEVADGQTDGSPAVNELVRSALDRAESQSDPYARLIRGLSRLDLGQVAALADLVDRWLNGRGDEGDGE